GTVAHQFDRRLHGLECSLADGQSRPRMEPARNRCFINSTCLMIAVSGVLFFSAASLPAMQAKSNAARIIVDSRERFQFIEGFGVNFTGPYFRDDQKAMFDMLIDDLGASLFRVVPYLVYSNWEEVNDNGDPKVMNWEYYNNRYSTPIFEATWKGL